MSKYLFLFVERQHMSAIMRHMMSNRPDGDSTAAETWPLLALPLNASVGILSCHDADWTVQVHRGGIHIDKGASFYFERRRFGISAMLFELGRYLTGDAHLSLRCCEIFIYLFISYITLTAQTPGVNGASSRSLGPGLLLVAKMCWIRRGGT